MSIKTNLPVAITLGEPGGIGPRIIFETPIMNNWEIEAKHNLNYAKEILEKI